jgi:two-component system, sensor histidine kinase
MSSLTDATPANHRPYSRQLWRTLTVLGLSVGLALPVSLFLTTWPQARQFTQQTAQELARILAEEARYALLVGSQQEAQGLVDQRLQFPDLLAVALLDGDGRLLAEATRDEERAQRRERVVVAIRAPEYHAADGPVRHAAAPVLGHVALTLSLDRAFDFALETAGLALWPLGMLTLVLGVAVARLSLRLLTPLALLVRDLETPVETPLPPPPATSPAEVHQLWSALVAMRARLAAHHRHLEARVAARTEELSQALEAAEQANRAKTLFLANVSHELRTPLQAILLQARLLEPPGATTDCEPLAVIRHASHQLLGLIEQLLTLTKAEAGHPLEVTYQQVELGGWIEQVVATVRPTLAPGNRLALHRPATECFAISDQGRLTQVLYNLIGNADKFTAGGLIEVRLTAGDDAAPIRITVTDCGIGIPAADLEQIFEPFYQGARGLTGRVSSGIGLGLWLSRCFMEALGGRLSVTSHPGAGSCFQLTLPRRPAPMAGHPLPEAPVPASAPNAAIPDWMRGSRLLLAEDEATIRLPLVQLLREAGFSVEACIDGTAARALLEPNPEGYAAVILDHRLPGCQGLELLRQLRARGHHRLPVVILTGDDRAPLQTAIRPLRARLIVKPVLPEDLIAVLVALIDPSRPPDSPVQET